MSLRSYNPTTPSLRGTVALDRSKLWKGGPLKKLVKGMSKTGGRNNYGRITSRHIGGGARKLYRLVDFKRSKHSIFAAVERIEYDPNRTAFIALIKYDDGEYSYILAPEGLNVRDRVVAAFDADIKIGNNLPLSEIPIGTFVHNIEMTPGKGGQLARSAGTSAQVMGKDSGYALLRLSSGEVRMVQANCCATIGTISNADNQNISLGKAGATRHRGRRPVVRGVAMNPIDHPHGGGEGKTSGGRHPCTPWGKPTKGKRTRNNKRTNYLIIQRRYAK